MKIKKNFFFLPPVNNTNITDKIGLLNESESRIIHTFNKLEA